MKISRIFLLDLCIVVTFILLFFWSFGIFGPVGNGFPKGDDAQTHAGWVLFIVENWPNANWYPGWYGGFPVFLSYHPLAYYLWALFAVITGWSVESTLFFFSALSYCLTGIGLYGLVYRITENNDSALLSPLLVITSSGFFGLLSVGGAYTRAFATMFWVLSLWSLVSYIKTGKKRFYLSTIILMSCTFTSNILIGFIAAFVNLLILLCCIDGWKKRFFHLLKVFVPVAALSAYFYIPFLVFYLSRFTSFSIRGGHYSIPLPLVMFLGASWQPLLFSLIALLIVRYRKVKFDYVASGFLKALMVVVSFFTIYTLIDIPPNLRLFASYDGIYFLPFFLAIFAGIIFGGIFSKTSVSSTQLSSIRLRLKKTLSFALLLGIILSSIILYPLLIGYVVDPELESWNNAWYSAQQVINIDPNEMNFRLATDWIHAIRGFHYNYDVPQTGGVHPLGMLYQDWYYWFEDAVFTSENNWQETNFLLDWYAAKWLLVGKVIHYTGGGELSRRYGLIEKFLTKPERYEIASLVSVPAWSYWGGPIYLFEYKFAGPIISATNVTTLLVIGEKAAYDSVFQSLAYSGYSSRFVIPIRGHKYIDDYTSDELKKFDIIALYDFEYHNGTRAWMLLEDYVGNGGGLIIDTGYSDASFIPLPSPIDKTTKISREEWNFTHTNNQATNWIDFGFFSPPAEFSVSLNESVRPWARTILRSYGNPIIAIGEYGKGRVAWTGLNLPYHIVAYKNSMESLLLSNLMNWASGKLEMFSSSIVDAGDSTLGWVAQSSVGAEVNLEVSNEKVTEGNSLKAEYKFTAAETQEFVEFKYDPAGSWDWSDEEFLSFWVYGDNSSHSLKVAVLAPFWPNFLQVYPYPKIDWIGWKRFVIPIDEMSKNGSPTLTNVNAISLIIERDSAEDGAWRHIYFDDIRVARIRPEEQEENHDYKVDRSNPERVTVKINQTTSGVLFKESYFESWYAYLVDKDGIRRDLRIDRAGPDFMYIHMPKDVKFPVEIVFEYRITVIEWFSNITSISTLVILVVYGLGLPVEGQVVYALKKLRKLVKVRAGDKP